MSTYKRKVKLAIPEVRNNSLKFNTRTTDIISIEGATSSKFDVDLHDIPYEAMMAIGRRFAYGRKRHGRFNWRRGDKKFAEERLKHLINHAMLFCHERRQDDLDALMCNGAMICWFYANGLISNNPVKEFMEEGKEKK
jgi:hypothetical protein